MTTPIHPSRRKVLAATGALIAMPALARAESAEIVIGAALPLTGASASFGQVSWSALQLACDLVNEQGGIKAMKGARLKPMVADTESKPEVAASQTEQLIRRGAVTLFGCNQSAASIIATQVAERAGIPFITAYDIDPAITARGFKYTFRASPLIDAYARDVLTFIKGLSERNGRPVKRVVVFSENSIAGQSANRAAVKTAAALGLEVADAATYDIGKTQNFAPHIARFKSVNAEAYVGHSRVSDGILIVRTMKELGFNPTAMGGILGAPSDPEFAKNLGPDADYILSSDSYSPQLKIPGMKGVADRFEAMAGRPMDVGSATMFSDIAILRDALERGATTEPKALREAIAATDLKPGDRGFFLLGGVKFTATGDNERAGGMISMLRAGRSTPVYPADVAESDGVYPKPAWA